MKIEYILTFEIRWSRFVDPVSIKNSNTLTIYQIKTCPLNRANLTYNE